MIDFHCSEAKRVYKTLQTILSSKATEFHSSSSLQPNRNMSTILSAASNAAQSIIKNIVQGASVDDDDKKMDSDYYPLNAADQMLAAKDKIEDAIGYDDSKELEAETDEEEEVISDEIEEEEEDVTESECASLESEHDYLDESLSAEMQLALEHVRKLALFQQEELVNNICDTYSSFNGSEPTINDLVAIFGRVQKSLADEAAEDESEADDEEYDDEADSDYSPDDGVDNLQVLKDLQEDFDDEESESGSEDAADSDYDPNDAEDIGQALKDKEDDQLDSADDVSMESVESEKIDYAEDKIINSESFDDEYFAAIECVRNSAKSDKAEILKKIKEEYQDVFGEDATNEIILEAFQQFVGSGDEEAEYESEEEEEEQGVDPKDMELALENVRRLAKQHQSKFVENIATTFEIINGFEPSQDELASIFEAIREEFADETRAEFLDKLDEEQVNNDEEKEEVEEEEA